MSPNLFLPHCHHRPKYLTKLQTSKRSMTFVPTTTQWPSCSSKSSNYRLHYSFQTEVFSRLESWSSETTLCPPVALTIPANPAALTIPAIPTTLIRAMPAAFTIPSNPGRWEIVPCSLHLLIVAHTVFLQTLRFSAARMCVMLLHSSRTICRLQYVDKTILPSLPLIS